jgi:hypothetical protein
MDGITSVSEKTSKLGVTSRVFSQTVVQNYQSPMIEKQEFISFSKESLIWWRGERKNSGEKVEKAYTESE